MKPFFQALYRIGFCLLILSSFTGCNKLFVNNLNKISASATVAIEKYNNPELLGKALPNNLIMSEGYLGTAPDNVPLLVSTAKSYGLYANGFVEDVDKEHAIRLYGRGKDLGMRALKQNEEFKDALGDGSLENFTSAVKFLQIDYIEALFVTMNNWLAWISLNVGDPEAMMDFPKAEVLMHRILELDENYYHGGIHAAFGTYYGSLSKAMGGQPEKSKQHFEKAFKISQNNFLYFHVLYARTYLIQIQDRKSFEETLKKVLATPSKKDNQMTMANEIAKIKAKNLLDRIDEYFL